MNQLKRLQLRIEEKAQDVSASPIIIVAFGDSVTQGFTRAGTIEPKVVYHQRLKEMLELAYPRTTFSVINAGVAGHTAAQSLARLERDVIRFQPDLTLIAFGLNDAARLGANGAGIFAKTLQEMIKAIQQKTQSEIVLLTPNFMVTKDNPNIHPDERHYLEDLLPIQTGGMLQRYAETIRQLAQQYQLLLADVYQAWSALSAQGIDTDSMLANGLNHPDAEAHYMAAKLLCDLIMATSEEFPDA